MTVGRIAVADDQMLRMLLVEDDEDMGALLLSMFERNPDYAITVKTVRTLASAQALLSTDDFDVVLLDLGLPDSDGLRTARDLLSSVRPPTAVVIVTALRDQGMAASSLRLGVQDYILKEDVTQALATRVVHYAVTRARLTEELALARRGEERERELRRLERLAAESSPLTVSAQMLGAGSVAERLGAARYEGEIVAEYLRIYEAALDEQAFRGPQTVARDLHSLAAVLGYLGAGPRDVVDLHSVSLRRFLAGATSGTAPAVVEEGRVLVLQLMGRLVSYYRDRSMGTALRSSGSRSASAESASNDDDKAEQ